MDNKLFGRVFKNTGANPTSADLLAEVMLVDGANNTAGANGALNYWRLSSETTLLNSTPTASGDTVNNLNSQFDDLEITQLPIEWTGNTSTAFATAGNWVHNHPPRPWDIMTVPDVSSGSGNFPALAATNEVKWLTLQSNASASQMAANNLTLDSLTIMPNGTHSIGSGTLTINDSLYLRSTASGTGLLVNNSGGAVSIGAGGGVIAERYIPNNSGYHYLSAPVTGQTIGDLGLSNGASPGYTYEPDPALGQPYPSPFPNIFRYDETDVTNNPNVDDDEYGWESYTAAANPMMMPYGYAVNAGAGQTVTYRGGFSGSDFTENLSYSNSGDPAMDGWHLLGNPYTAALDWDQMDATNSGNFSSTVYYWNPATSQYEMYNATTATGMGNAIIPPGQGFFVHNTSGGAANFAVNQSAQVGTASSFYKTSGAAVATHLQLHIENPNGDGDNTFVVFDGGATEQFESRYDAYKLFTDQKVPSLFTQWEGQAYAQSAFPELTQERSVPLHARFEHDGNYTLTAEAVHEFGANDEIWLEDLKTGKLTNFSVASASYNFQATAGEDEGRFMLHFKAGQTTARPGQQHAEVANIYSSGKTVVVEFAQERAAQPAQVSVYSLSGQQVASQERPAQQAQMRMALPHLADGIYLVKVTGQGVSTRRLLLR
jgi:hypothetical protein